MVNASFFHQYVRQTYSAALKKDICLLAVGGSLGRGNYVGRWSDADLLLVLRRIDGGLLRLVGECEGKVSKRFGLEVDTMITSKCTIEHTPPERLHGKIKNFLFFLPKTAVLVEGGVRLPTMDFRKFAFGFWVTFAEQEKNFLRRNADANLSNRNALERLLRKNIKIIFLFLKQGFATPHFVPATYEEVLSIIPKEIAPGVRDKLEQYIEMRARSALDKMPISRLRREVDVSIKTFQTISERMVQLLRIRQ